MSMELFDYIRYEDLNEDGRLVWDVLGREAALKLIFAVGGTRLYLPSPYRLEARARRRLARELEARGLSRQEVLRVAGAVKMAENWQIVAGTLQESGEKPELQ